MYIVLRILPVSEFFFELYYNFKCNDKKNPFKVSKPCLKSCQKSQKVGKLNPPFCIHHHIYKTQYKTFQLLNICTVLYNLDLLHVDLLASGASLFWPPSGRPRATKSREVDLSHLKGLHLHFAPKMGSGVTCIWGFRFHLRVLDFNSGMCWFHSK